MDKHVLYLAHVGLIAYSRELLVRQLDHLLFEQLLNRFEDLYGRNHEDRIHRIKLDFFHLVFYFLQVASSLV